MITDSRIDALTHFYDKAILDINTNTEICRAICESFLHLSSPKEQQDHPFFCPDGGSSWRFVKNGES